MSVNVDSHDGQRAGYGIAPRNFNPRQPSVQKIKSILGKLESISQESISFDESKRIIKEENTNGRRNGIVQLDNKSHTSRELVEIKLVLIEAEKINAAFLTEQDIVANLEILSNQAVAYNPKTTKKKKGKGMTMVDGKPVTPVTLNDKTFLVKGNMQNERERYMTFLTNDWPKDCPISPSKLAKAGFFYVGLDDTVQCFVCNGKINNWEYGDIAMGEHKRLYPKCNFVRGIDTTNVPMQGLADQQSMPRTKETKGGAYKSAKYKEDDLVEKLEKLSLKNKKPENETLSFYEKESNRLLSFNSWPMSSPVEPFDLAAAGFYYLGGVDQVQCFACFGKIENWRQGDRPRTEHKRLFPNCSFMMGLDVGNVPMTSEEKAQAKRFFDQREPPLRTPQPISGNVPLNIELGSSRLQPQPVAFNRGRNVHPRELVTSAQPADDIVRNAKYPQYSFEQERLYTYRGWPLDSPTRPAFVARAGFFYTGQGDEVKCFYCGGGLKEWTVDDEPWDEHARWYPKCGWLLQQRGPAFVDHVHRKYADEHSFSGYYEPRMGIPVDKPTLQSTLPSYPSSIASPLSHDPTPSPAVNQIVHESGSATPSHVLDQMHQEASLHKEKKTKTKEKKKTKGKRITKSVDQRVEEVLQSDIVQFILEMGNDEEIVRRVVRNRIAAGGVPYETSEDLLNAVFTEQTRPSGSTNSSMPALSLSHLEYPLDEEEDDDEEEDEVSNGPDPRYNTYPQDAFPVPDTRLLNSYLRDQRTEAMAGDNESMVSNEVESAITSASLLSDADELEKLREKQLCKICLDKDVEVLFAPCFHLVACENCSSFLDDCPICRRPIDSKLKIFMA